MARILASIQQPVKGLWISASLLVLFLNGCASTNAFPGHNHFLHPRTAISSGQNWLGIAVWLEDQCESQEIDEQSATLFEALHDGLVYPTETLVAVTAVTVIGTAWSLEPVRPPHTSSRRAFAQSATDDHRVYEAASCWATTPQPLEVSWLRPPDRMVGLPLSLWRWLIHDRSTNTFTRSIAIHIIKRSSL